MENIVAVILAAGRGTRMHPFSTHYPKPGTLICNKPLLQYSIETFRELGIREIFVVIGHLGHVLAQKFGDGSSLGVKLQYVEQAQLLGIASALGQMEPHISSPMFVALGDIFFKTDNLSSMIDLYRQRNASAVLAVKYEKDPSAIRRNFTIRCDETGRVRRVIEKPRYVDTTLKGCGLYLFDLPVFDAIRRTPRTAMRDEYEITDTIQIMVDDNLPVYTSDVVNWDVNLSTPADVLVCNLFELKNRGLERLIGKNTNIHPGAELSNVIVGDGAIINEPITITNSVIFPGTVVDAKSNIDRFIITPEHRIDCRLYANDGAMME
ncbi:MAG: NTP transferase domain-containing protein [Chromatiaceae bacterium]|nr:NTP transferase domain-containing protein [Bacteroidota bacterium]MCB1860751.1 NTP transferase domain-containing protein [Gammaproteobacteria bacterium]MCP5427189.1 NTP transferase domain-containing protein [Chromatiaceae bacterium]MCB1870659.1 NTP transferase domain-containing protein [Gammaproteobacteria bacterium]MCB1880446.1 NTP transferase domain-containing protein [Gammaproteobacteria bacterium]